MNRPYKFMIKSLTIKVYTLSYLMNEIILRIEDERVNYL